MRPKWLTNEKGLLSDSVVSLESFPMTLLSYNQFSCPFSVSLSGLSSVLLLLIKSASWVSSCFQNPYIFPGSFIKSNARLYSGNPRSHSRSCIRTWKPATAAGHWAAPLGGQLGVKLKGTSVAVMSQVFHFLSTHLYQSRDRIPVLGCDLLCFLFSG